MWKLITQSKRKGRAKQARKYSSLMIAQMKEVWQVFSVNWSDTKKVGDKSIQACGLLLK